MNIEDFFPTYPFIDVLEEEKELNVQLREKSFVDEISLKKEFEELMLVKPNAKQQGEDLYNHQIFISRFFSSFTPYDRLLLFHEVGVGKTCALFGATEELRTRSTRFKNAYILTRNPGLLANLKYALVVECTNMKFFAETDREMFLNFSKFDKQREIAKILKKTLKKFYKFYTYTEFLHEFKNNTLEDAIVAIDEAHNVQNDIKDFRQILSGKNLKILLLTATPMRNSALDFCHLINLILPGDKTFTPSDLQKMFTNNFLNSEESIKTFYSKITGYVSYLRADFPHVNIHFQGMVEAPFKKLKLVHVDIHPLRLQAYKELKQQLQVQLTTAMPNFDINEDEQMKDDNIETTAYDFKNFVQLEFFELLNNKTAEETKAGIDFKANIGPKFIKIPEFASKEDVLQWADERFEIYAKVVRTILQNPRKNTLVFSKGLMGCNVIGALLRLLNFRYVTGSQALIDPQPAFTIITSATLNDNISLISSFNEPRNMHGEFLQIIIFSGVLEEGFSFYNVQQIHITVPHWHLSNIDQIIGRGVRSGSHKEILKNQDDVDVDIYLYNFRVPSEMTVSQYKWLISENKDIPIKALEKHIRAAAVDCVLFKNQNLISYGKDGDRSCLFEACQYDCHDSTIKQGENYNLDITTKELYFNKKQQDVILHILKLIMKRCGTVHISFVYNVLEEKGFSKFEILKAVYFAIQANVDFSNNFSNRCYLREMYNVLYLVDPAYRTTDFFANMHTRNLTSASVLSFKQNIEKNIIAPLLEFFANPDLGLEEKKIYFKNFSLSVQQLFLKNFFLDETKHDVLTLLGYEINPKRIAFTLNDIEYVYDKENSVWTENEAREKRKKDEQKPMVSTPQDNPYTAIISKDDPKPQNFKIKKKDEPQDKEDKRKKARGIDCMTYDKQLPHRAILLLQLVNEIYKQTGADVYTGLQYGIEFKTKDDQITEEKLEKLYNEVKTKLLQLNIPISSIQANFDQCPTRLDKWNFLISKLQIIDDKTIDILFPKRINDKVNIKRYLIKRFTLTKEQFQYLLDFFKFSISENKLDVSDFKQILELPDEIQNPTTGQQEQNEIKILQIIAVTRWLNLKRESICILIRRAFEILNWIVEADADKDVPKIKKTK